MSRFQFVADNSATFEVKRLCVLIEGERSSYYAWRAGAPARSGQGRSRCRARRTDPKGPRRGQHPRCTRITAELDDGLATGERVNQQAGSPRRWPGSAGTSRNGRSARPCPSPRAEEFLLKRDFTAQAPNQRYVGDITYLPLADAAGGGTSTWPPSSTATATLGGPSPTTLRTELVEDALKAAAATGRSLGRSFTGAGWSADWSS